MAGFLRIAFEKRNIHTRRARKRQSNRAQQLQAEYTASGLNRKIVFGGKHGTNLFEERSLLGVNAVRRQSR